MHNDDTFPRGRMAVIAPSAFLNSLAIGIINLGLLFIVKDVYGAGPAAIGWFGATWSISYFTGCLLLKRWTDRIAPRASMATMLLGSASILAAFLAFPGLPQAFAAYSAYGFITAFFWPPLMGWLSRGIEGNSLSRAASMFNTAWSVGGVISPWLAGFLSERGKFLPVWVAMGIFMANGAFVLASRAIMKDPHENDGRTAASEGAPATDRSTPLRYPAWVGVFLIYAAMGVVFNVFPVFARDELRVPESTVGLLLTVRALATAAGFVALGRWNGWQFKRLAIPALSLAGAVILGIVAMQRLPLGFALGFVAAGLVMAAIYTNSLFYATSGARDRDRRASTHEALLTAGQVLGSVAGGMMYQAWSLPLVFGVFGLLLLAGSIAQLAMVRAK